jgi:hypothetical protein
MVAIFLCHATNLASVQGLQVIACCPPPEDRDFVGDRGTPHGFPDASSIVPCIAAPSEPPNTIVQVISKFISAFNREYTITFKVPSMEVFTGL